jgi:hypothetical protein
MIDPIRFMTYAQRANLLNIVKVLVPGAFLAEYFEGGEDESSDKGA